MATHSCVISPRFKGALAHVAEGKYGRMFPDLPPLEIEEGLLRALGRAGSAMDAPLNAEDDFQTDNPRIPAGFFEEILANSKCGAQNVGDGVVKSKKREMQL